MQDRMLRCAAEIAEWHDGTHVLNADAVPSGRDRDPGLLAIKG
jgi:hypothetical protein